MPTNAFVAKLLDFAVALVSGGIGAGIGAWAAFSLERSRDRDAAAVGELGALQRAIFALEVQRRTLVEYEVRALAPARDDPNRAYFMSSVTLPELPARVDLPSIAFILGTPHAPLVRDVLEAEFSVVALLHVQQTHGRLTDSVDAKLTEPPSAPRPRDDWREVAGPMLAHQLEEAAAALYDFSDQAMQLNEAAVTGLRAFAATRFPRAILPPALLFVRPVTAANSGALPPGSTPPPSP